MDIEFRTEKQCSRSTISKEPFFIALNAIAFPRLIIELLFKEPLLEISKNFNVFISPRD